MFVLEALRAKHGDALILHYGTKAKPRIVVIDGGPSGVYNDALRPRLEELREERKLAGNEPLEIDLMMVSHLDADHITGILDLARNMRQLREDNNKPLPWRIRRFWHNTFDDIIGNNDGSLPASSASLSTASLNGFIQPEGSGILASVGQGRELRNLLRFLTLDGNPLFKGLVRLGSKKNPKELDGLTMTVIGPDDGNLVALQADWDKKIKELLKKKDKKSAAEVADFVDKSVYNLSSIVVLAEANKKRMLLTGDARGDYTLAGLESAGLLKNGRIDVDLLKLPHHGSERNVELEYFQAIRAKHYVISANGRDSNPDVETLELISEARKGDDDFTIHLTNPTKEFVDDGIGKAVAKFFAKDKAKGRKYKVVERESNELSIFVKLA